MRHKRIGVNHDGAPEVITVIEPEVITVIEEDAPAPKAGSPPSWAAYPAQLVQER